MSKRINLKSIKHQGKTIKIFKEKYLLKGRTHTSPAVWSKWAYFAQIKGQTVGSGTTRKSAVAEAKKR